MAGERLARYGFGDGHPFGPDRHAAFIAEFSKRGLDRRVRSLETRAAIFIGRSTRPASAFNALNDVPSGVA